MNRTFNYSPIFSRKRKDIDEFLEESPLWNGVYDVFCDANTYNCHTNISNVTIFNEARYQCVRIFHDKHPEEQFWDCYIKDAQGSLLSEDAGNLCFCIVYVVLSLYKNPPKQFLRTCKILKEKVFKTDSKYFPLFEEYVVSQKSRDVSFDFDLSCEPLSLEEFKTTHHWGEVYDEGEICEDWIYDFDVVWWMRATSNFERKGVREVVSFWKDKNDQLEVVDIIEQAFKELEHVKTEKIIGHTLFTEKLIKSDISKEFFEALREEIANKEDDPILSAPTEDTETVRWNSELENKDKMLAEKEKLLAEALSREEEMKQKLLSVTEASPKSRVHLVKKYKTALAVLVEAMYKEGWLVDENGKNLTNRNNCIKDIAQWGFNEEIKHVQQLLHAPKDRGSDLNTKFQKLLETAKKKYE